MNSMNNQWGKVISYVHNQKVVTTSSKHRNELDVSTLEIRKWFSRNTCRFLPNGNEWKRTLRLKMYMKYYLLQTVGQFR